ncbi:uncharacterized protein LOC119687004 [Teleopsis dalmanni]|uniref:uncharacterized protein LOC119678432 n=1 Tax=Teleopsis dalmanni TaxID=139649 RepID=UPI0018CCA651|nr:uncharacterized protein LOC119678432 [Teleopsis dalmanni]XP_037957071.1 uncharacterized protein LOC119687004 [Teleopsis dalmanni]
MEGFSKRNVRRLCAKKKRELLALRNVSENIDPSVSNSSSLTQDAIQENLEYCDDTGNTNNTISDINVGFEPKHTKMAEYNIESEFNINKLTLEERLTRIKESVGKISQNQDAILKELKLVKESNIDVIVKFHTLMNMMEKRSDTAVSDNCFPIKTFEELGNMDALCATKSAQYAKLIKSIIQPEGIKKNLHRIIDRTLVLELNYDGMAPKKHLRNLNS